MIGDYRHAVTFENPSAAVPDGLGGFTETWSPIDPPIWRVRITPASASDIERLAAGAVSSMATHVIAGRFHPDISTASRMVFDGRTFAIAGLRNVEERSITMELLAIEKVD